MAEGVMVTQEQIDRLQWYHDFDFPGGLTARTQHRDNAAFFKLWWTFLGEQLRGIDFAGKSVIDVGCWDGYFSFLMEQLGAASVLAVDDFSQNWGSAECFRIAHELYRSNVTLMPDVSVYDLSQRIPEKFDTIFFSGVYYHLHSPFQAFAEIRARCHNDSIVIIAGQCLRNEEESFARFYLDNPKLSKFLPTSRLLREMLRACYLQVTSIVFLSDLPVPDRFNGARPADLMRLARIAIEEKRSGRAAAQQDAANVVMLAQPFVGENNCHQYKPPFGLAQFDPRWAG